MVLNGPNPSNLDLQLIIQEIVVPHKAEIQFNEKNFKFAEIFVASDHFISLLVDFSANHIST